MMSPMSFIRWPLGWLSAISRYRAHTSGGPNFAFDACVARAARGGVPDLDLSSWKVAFNGAEPVQPDTLRRFAETFAPYGFSPSALYPCYGLAEATLMVTGSRKGRGPRVIDADPEALGRGASPGRPAAAGARSPGPASSWPGKTSGSWTPARGGRARRTRSVRSGSQATTWPRVTGGSRR